jgi:hypothetical protein
LILDNLETVWEPADSYNDIEKFLSLLTDVEDLALMASPSGFSVFCYSYCCKDYNVRCRRPAKVHWTRPFLQPLSLLLHDAAHKAFIDIAEDHHNPEEVNKVLSLTDNVPLVINLIAHLVDVEGCSTVLSCWEEERTSMFSEGYDKRSNLDLSI